MVLRTPAASPSGSRLQAMPRREPQDWRVLRDCAVNRAYCRPREAAELTPGSMRHRAEHLIQTLLAEIASRQNGAHC